MDGKKMINQDLELLTQTRAKAVDGSKWVYGSYYYNTYPKEYREKYNSEAKDGPVIITKKDGAIDIDPDTVCRAVRVGGKIYHEGDVIKMQDGEIWVIEWTRNAWVLRSLFSKYGGNCISSTVSLEKESNFKLIGNPELKEAKK